MKRKNHKSLPAKTGRLAAASLLLAAPLGAVQGDRITAPDIAALDWFGYDIAVDGEIAVVGSWRDDDMGPNTGSAHIIHSDAAGTGTYVQKLSLSGGTAEDRAGLNVAIGHGIVAVSCPGRVVTRADGSQVTGAVGLFQEAGGVWLELDMLDDPSRSEGDLFGESVAIHENYILVGAPRDDEFAPDGGAVYVFERTASGWTRTQKLAPADVGTHDYFGHDMAVAGLRAVASSYNDDDRGVNAGAAYVLDLVGGAWRIGQKLTANEGSDFDLYGTSVAMIEDTIVISAPQNQDADDDAVNDEGAAFVYEWNNTAGQWTETMTLRPGDPSENHRFGIDVAMQDGVIVVGASHSDSGTLNSGSVHIFRQRHRDWFEVSRHVSATSQAYDYLGLSVAMGSVVFVGVPGANEGFAGAGAVDLVPLGRTTIWGQSFCHSSQTVGGFKRMGGNANSAGTIGRLTTAGSNSYSRNDLVLRSVGLPAGSIGILLMGAKKENNTLGNGQFCLSSGGSGYRFRNRYATVDGRHIERKPFGRIEEAAPGASSILVGTRMYAQVAYWDTGAGTWNTTNALRIDVTN